MFFFICLKYVEAFDFTSLTTFLGNSNASFLLTYLNESHKFLRYVVARTSTLLSVLWHLYVRGRSQTTLTKFWPFLTTYPPALTFSMV